MKEPKLLTGKSCLYAHMVLGQLCFDGKLKSVAHFEMSTQAEKSQNIYSGDICLEFVYLTENYLDLNHTQD